VLLKEALQALRIRSEGIFVDATYGNGGHAREILVRLGSHGRLLVLDRDPRAVTAARHEHSDDSRVTAVHAPFSKLKEVVQTYGLIDRVDGILFDLGVSSLQLDDPQRGFSFQTDGPLDMRMDTTSGITAAKWLRSVSEDRLCEVIRTYGEERYARRIARAIVVERQRTSLDTTAQLARVISQAVPTREHGKHPSTRTFQAIRIYINRELEELGTVLSQTLSLLHPGGRLVVISFHSLEDRRVKRFMRDASRGDPFPPELPVPTRELGPKVRLVGRAVRPSMAEVSRNPRARSAVLRVAERLTHGQA